MNSHGRRRVELEKRKRLNKGQKNINTLSHSTLNQAKKYFSRILSSTKGEINYDDYVEVPVVDIQKEEKA